MHIKICSNRFSVICQKICFWVNLTFLETTPVLSPRINGHFDSPELRRQVKRETARQPLPGDNEHQGIFWPGSFEHGSMTAVQLANLSGVVTPIVRPMGGFHLMSQVMASTVQPLQTIQYLSELMVFTLSCKEHFF